MVAVRSEEPLTDLQLAQRIAERHPAYTEKFVREHYPTLFRFMRHLTRRTEDAEDLTQQAIIKACDQIRSFQGASSLRTWLHTVAFREYTHWRRRQRFTFRLPEAQSYVETAFESCEEAEALLAALTRLSNKLREAFLLHEVQGLSLEEVGEVLRIPAGTVKSRLHNARAQLRTLLEPAPEEIKYGKATYDCK